MAKKKKEWKFPVSADGNLLAYADDHTKDVTWLGNETEWELSLTFDGFDKGVRSAYRFMGQDELGRKWPMTVMNFIKMMGEVTIYSGKVTGRFGVVRRGLNYSLFYLGKKNS